MKQFKNLVSSHVWHIAIFCVATGLLFLLLWFRLGSLTYGNAADIEVATRGASTSWQAILSNPLNAPYTVVQHLVTLTGHTGITSLRLISTLFAILAVVLFYFVARQWHSMRVALLASWLFISSSWFLHVSRLGSPEILWLVSILAIVVLLTPNRNGRQNSLALPSTIVALCSVLYVPGMVWLVLAGVVLQRKNIREAWTASRSWWLRLLSIFAGLALLAPLLYAFIRTPELIKRWMGIPGNLDLDTESLQIIGRNLLSVPESLMLRSHFDAVHWLGNLPLLSSFEIVMLLLGTYFYATHFRAARTKFLMALAGISWLIVGISGINAITLVVPVMYLLIAGGIAYILHHWLKVFPNNPIARTIGIVVIMSVVLLTSIYQTRSYFVAWRYNPETAKVFHTKL